MHLYLFDIVIIMYKGDQYMENRLPKRVINITIPTTYFCNYCYIKLEMFKNLLHSLRAIDLAPKPQK